MPVTIKILILFYSLTGSFSAKCQELYKTTSAEVSFFSTAPVEDISAVSKEGISVINPATGEISFLVNIKTLQFPKGLMQEHFNENYMESDRYPSALFKGKLSNSIDPSADGKMQVTISGILEIHGVQQKREIPATVNISNGAINLVSQFDVACEDHNIKIPKILWKNIAEIVQVKVNANYIN